jgi:hypothetical protein
MICSDLSTAWMLAPRKKALQAVLLASCRPLTTTALEAPSVYLLNVIQLDCIRFGYTTKYKVTFVDILIAHGIEPRPEVIVKMYDLVTQTQTKIVEVCRLYDDTDLVQEVK